MNLGWLQLHTDAHSMQYVFCGNNGYANTCQCYVTRTLHVVFWEVTPRYWGNRFMTFRGVSGSIFKVQSFVNNCTRTARLGGPASYPSELYFYRTGHCLDNTVTVVRDSGPWFRLVLQPCFQQRRIAWRVCIKPNAAVGRSRFMLKYGGASSLRLAKLRLATAFVYWFLCIHTCV